MTAVAPRSLWRHRNFLLLWSGQSTSLVGTAVSTLALPLVALGLLHASTFQMGALAAVSSAPSLLIALPAGALVDRWPKRLVMLWCDLGRLLALGYVPVAATGGWLTLAQLYVVGLVTGTLAVFFDAAYQGYLPSLVEREQLMEGNARLGSSDAFAMLVGPALGGLLVSLVGAARTVTADAASYLVSAVSLVMVKAEEPPRRPRPSGRSLWAEVVEGLRYVFGHRLLRPVMLSNASGSFFLAGVNALWMVYAVRSLHWSPRAVGVVLAVGAVGGLLGGALVKPLVGRFGVPRVMLGTRMVLAPAELAIPLAPRGLPGQVAVGAGFVLVLMAGIAFTSSQRTFRQLVCPRELLGRMNASARWLQWGLRPVGSLLAGTLASWIGLRATLFAADAGLLLSAATLYLLTPLRHMREVVVPDPQSYERTPA